MNWVAPPSRRWIARVIICVLVTVLGTPAQSRWQVYSNDRFGYSMELPPGLQVSNRAADGSSVSWQTGTVRVQVSGSNNPYRIEPSEYFKRVRLAAADGIVEERTGSDEGRAWQESLYTKHGRRIHQKVFVGSGAINTLEFSYAYRYREEKERLGQRVVESFRPGDLSRAH